MILSFSVIAEYVFCVVCWKAKKHKSLNKPKLNLTMKFILQLMEKVGCFVYGTMIWS